MLLAEGQRLLAVKSDTSDRRDRNARARGTVQRVVSVMRMKENAVR